SQYMVAKSQADGNLTFDGHSKSVEELDNESRCRSLCLRLERALGSCCEEEIPSLLEMYDLLHRIGYGKQPDQSFLATQRQRVYTAWRAGNRNIQESQIYSLLKKSVNGRALRIKMLKNWVRTLCVHNCFPNVTAHENYQRLAIVMRENIDALIKDKNIMSEAYYGKSSKELKRKWYEVNRVEDFTTLSTPLLKSYRTFTNSLNPLVLEYEDPRKLDTAIFDELISRCNLNPYEHKTINLNYICV
ncbi:MAG: hypothetical protein K2J78_11095, partial [Muribaculaceae bacterium]|nr:hypothetical protein [Muribaculaceae bacterium]